MYDINSYAKNNAMAKSTKYVKSAE